MMSTKNWWFKFDFRVWRTDSNLRRCSFETRGIWVELLCIMHEMGDSEITGTYDEIARLVGCETNQIARCVIELSRTKTADVTNCNDEVTIMSRRIHRDLNTKESNRLRVQKHRSNADVTPMSQHRVRSKSKEEEKEPPNGGSKKNPPPPRKVVPTLTRIPKPFELTPERWAWLSEHVPGLDDPNFAHANFVEHWTNAPPGKAEKIDWNLTWQKGMKLAKKWQDEDKKRQAAKENDNGKRTNEHPNTKALREWADFANGG